MNKPTQIHAQTLKRGIDDTEKLIVKLLQIPNLQYAHKLFNQIPKAPPLFLFNKLIQAYSSQGGKRGAQPHKCIYLYTQIYAHNHRPNEHTFTFIFQACASLSACHGKMVHTQFSKSGFELDVYASTALVDMYAKVGLSGCARRVFDGMAVRDVPTWNSMIAGYARGGDMESAFELFRLMPFRSVVSWTAMVSGYSQNGQYQNALDMFLRMEREGEEVSANEVSLASVLPACANLGALEIGRRIEDYARRNGLFKNLYVSNAVLEMYARCGKIDVARRVFDEIGVRKNICTWNSMIMGLASHGKCNEALELFGQMLREGDGPDDITFVGVLSACTHGGMVVKGREIFRSMDMQYNITPKLEHYGCMIDLLGRTGELQEAYDLIQRMPMKPDSVVWGTLLGACSFHCNVELAEIAANYLSKLEPRNPGNYVILSNIYASAGKWDKMARLWKVMKGSQITKAAGYSFIEEGGQIHKFIVEDKLHPRSDEIYALVNGISAVMKFERNADDSEFNFEEL